MVQVLVRIGRLGWSARSEFQFVHDLITHQAAEGVEE
jgi:hypothetical protein